MVVDKLFISLFVVSMILYVTKNTPFHLFCSVGIYTIVGASSVQSNYTYLDTVIWYSNIISSNVYCPLNALHGRVICPGCYLSC